MIGYPSPHQVVDFTASNIKVTMDWPLRANETMGTHTCMAGPLPLALGPWPASGWAQKGVSRKILK